MLPKGDCRGLWLDFDLDFGFNDETNLEQRWTLGLTINTFLSCTATLLDIYLSLLRTHTDSLDAHHI
jgi:hypothetical protein